MEKLIEKNLSLLISNIRSKFDSLHEVSEAVIKQTIILPFFDVLGWDTSDYDEVFPEYSAGNQRVDYSLRHVKKDKVFIEIKKPREDLTIHQEQLLRYAFEAGIEIAVLTNGRLWWFYLPLSPGDWKDRICFSVDVMHQKEKEVVKNFINFLEKKNVVSGKSSEALKFARKIYQQEKKENKIRQEMVQDSFINEYNLQKYKDKGYIDAKDNVFFDRIVDACNFFGCNFKGIQRCFIRHPVESNRYLWFPKTGRFGKEWDNQVVDNGEMITERERVKSSEWLNRDLFSRFKCSIERVVCTGEINPSTGRFGYRFRGVFILDKEATQKGGPNIYKRIDTKAKGYTSNFLNKS